MANGFTLTTRMWFDDPINYGPYAENNWHFSYNPLISTGIEEEAGHARAAVMEFWNNSDIPNKTALCEYLSGMLSGDVDCWFVDWEDSTNTMQPLDSWNLTTVGAEKNLASETACCLTTTCDPYGSHRRQSFYNRVYLGPLTVDASAGTGPTPARPAPEFREDIVSAYTSFQEVLDILLVDSCRAAVYSPKHDSSGLVTGGWVDDSWDTIRRRGLDPTLKDALTIL